MHTAQSVHKQEAKNTHFFKTRPNIHLTSLPSSANNYSSPYDPAREVSDENEKQRPILKRNGHSIHLVDSLKQRIEANALIKQMYSARGYHTKNVTTFSHNPNQITFEASSAQRLSGTLTLAIHSNNDLLANNLYKDEINAFRAEGRKVCELSKFASNLKGSSKEIFASIFHLAYIYAYEIHKAKDAFIEVNPRHSFFYKRLLGFRQIGKERICKRVNAPAVLLHLDLDYMSAQISSLASRGNHTDRSIYPYFLSQHEEKRLTNEIRHKLAEQQHNPIFNRA